MKIRVNREESAREPLPSIWTSKELSDPRADRLLNEVLAALEPAMQVILWLSYRERQSVAEIARALGWDEQVVRKYRIDLLAELARRMRTGARGT
jgi:DNA-directed RNA polymerase specialized sigma24 family protein